MCRVLIFEAVTGGGFLQTETLPDSSLLQEGLTMLQSLATDLRAELQDPRFIPQVFRSALKTSENQTLQLIAPWDARLPSPSFIPSSETGCQGTSTEPFYGNVNFFTSDGFSADSVDAVSLPVTSVISSWTMPTSSITDHLSEDIQFFPISSSEQLKPWLRQQAETCDFVWIIAPEPTLAIYLRWLEPWQNKCMNLPVSVAKWAEDKRNYTTLPCWKTDDVQTMLPSPSTQPDWFASETDWVWKPANQCGSQGVYRLRFQQPPASPQQAIQWIADWWSRHPEQPDATGPYLLCQYGAGLSYSVSFFIHQGQAVQFPACRQQIDMLPGPQTDNIQSWKLSYTGSHWAAPALQRIAETEVTRWFQEDRHDVLQNLWMHGAGWFSMDFVTLGNLQEGHHPGVALVDINARLSSSYNLLRTLMPQR